MRRTLCLLLALMLLLCGCSKKKTPPTPTPQYLIRTDSSTGSAEETAPTGRQPDELTSTEPASTELPTEPTEPASTEPEATEPAPQSTSLYDLRVAMLRADSGLPDMMSVSSEDADAEDLFFYLSELDYSKVARYFLSYAADGKSYEIAAIELRDAADVPELMDSLKDHVFGRVQLYKNYAPEQVSRAENAKIVSNGRWVALIMCDAQDAVRNAFNAGVN